MANGDPPPWNGPTIVMYGGCPEPFKRPEPFIPYGEQTETAANVTWYPAYVSEDRAREIAREEIRADRKRLRKWIKRLVKKMLAKP